MKNYKPLIVLVLFSLVLFACNSNQDGGKINPEQEKSRENQLDFVDTIATHGNYIQYNNEPQLYEGAELIVIAKTDKDFIDREHVINYLSHSDDEKHLPELIEDFYTRTPLTVSKVLKKPQSSSLSKGDPLTIIEPISVLKTDEGLKRITIGQYLELEKDENYILYLSQNTFGEYSIINMHDGKFNLDSPDKFADIATDKPVDLDNIKVKHDKIRQEMEIRFEKELKQ